MSLPRWDDWPMLGNWNCKPSDCFRKRSQRSLTATQTHSSLLFSPPPPPPPHPPPPPPPPPPPLPLHTAATPPKSDLVQNKSFLSPHAHDLIISIWIISNGTEH